MAVTLNRPLRFKINLKILVYAYNPLPFTSSLFSISSNGFLLINGSDFYILALLIFLKGRDKVPRLFLNYNLLLFNYLSRRLMLIIVRNTVLFDIGLFNDFIKNYDQITRFRIRGTFLNQKLPNTSTYKVGII